MDIKQFQKGQSAYMLKENHGYSKPPDSHEQNSKYFVQEFPHMGRKGFSNHAMICSFIVMKCEGFSMVSDLVDYLYNNLLIAHYCGFDISRPLPSYWTFDRFLINFDHSILSDIMKAQVLSLADKGIIDSSFIGLDSTPIEANTSQNNPKSFISNKFNPAYQLTSQKLIRTVSSEFMLLPTRRLKRNINSTGDIKIMSL